MFIWQIHTYLVWLMFHSRMVGSLHNLRPYLFGGCFKISACNASMSWGKKNNLQKWELVTKTWSLHFGGATNQCDTHKGCIFQWCWQVRCSLTCWHRSQPLTETPLTIEQFQGWLFTGSLGISHLSNDPVDAAQCPPSSKSYGPNWIKFPQWV